MLSAIANIYRDNFSRIGRVERLEEDAKELQTAHGELLELLKELPPKSDEINSDESDDEIDQDAVRDRKVEICIVKARIRVVKRGVQKGNRLKRLLPWYECGPGEQPFERLEERVETLSKDTMNTTARALRVIDTDRDERKKNTKGNTKGNPPKIPLAMQSVVEEKDPASS